MLVTTLTQTTLKTFVFSNESRDGIATYQSGRYISSFEAARRIHELS